MFIKIALVVIIILLIKLIANQEEIDYHICEVSRGGIRFEIDDMIINRGPINLIIWVCKRIIAELVYIGKHIRKGA